MTPTTKPIMICTVSEGRYHGRPGDRGAVELMAGVIITKRHVDRAVPCPPVGRTRPVASSMPKLRGRRRLLLASPDGAADPPFQFRAPALNCRVFVTYLECTSCGLRHDWSRLQNLCGACQKPLFAIVDLAAAGRALRREKFAAREKPLWRYRELLPLAAEVEPVSLGEGGTPLLRAKNFAEDVDLWIKDESLNPTQSFKARGMSVAVSMAKYLGASKLAVPSAGNAGGALAA